MTRFNPGKRLTSFGIAVALAFVSTHLAAQQPKTFSLDVVFNPPAPGLGVYSDSKGTYSDKGDLSGKTPNVYMGSQNIQFDLTGSTRALCFDFSTLATAGVSIALAPTSQCTAVSGNTLITENYGGVGDLPDGSNNMFSLVLYWTGMGADSKAHDYSVAFRNRDSNGLSTSRSGDVWTLGTSGYGVVSVYLSGRGGGWNTVGTYTMPFEFTAAPHTPNLRARK